MAEAFFNHYAGVKAQAVSAGTHPAAHKDRNVVEAMNEVGIDIGSQRPKMLTREMLDGADRAITMGCGVEGVCPAAIVPVEDWGLQDPEGQPMEKVKEIRDEVRSRVERLIHDMGLHGGGDRCRDTATTETKDGSQSRRKE